MSRIGNTKIILPAETKLEVTPAYVQVTGKKGTQTVPMFQGVGVSLQENEIAVKRNSDAPQIRAFHGLVRALLNNAIIGVNEGFKKTLVLQGVGYRAAKKGESISLSLGFSHEILYLVPNEVTVEVVDSTKIIISGISKERVGQVASDIRSFKPPEPYKGKGIRYENEKVRKKAGKTGKK